MEVNKDTKRLIVNGINKLYPLTIEQLENGVAFKVGNVMTGCTGMVVRQEDIPLIADFLKYLDKECNKADKSEGDENGR